VKEGEEVAVGPSTLTTASGAARGVVDTMAPRPPPLAAMTVTELEGVTVITAEALAESAFAVMVAVPGLIAVRRPFVSMVATP